MVKTTNKQHNRSPFPPRHNTEFMLLGRFNDMIFWGFPNAAGGGELCISGTLPPRYLPDSGSRCKHVTHPSTEKKKKSLERG